MTAEIAVFNKSGIALAADSAVTISGNDVFKINNGAEKLFSLSKHHPVGVMVYDNGSFCDLPWELIIKSYRNNLNKTNFATLKEYADHFFDYLKNQSKLFPLQLRKDNLSKVVWTAFFKIQNQVKEFVKQESIKAIDYYDYLLELLVAIENQLINTNNEITFKDENLAYIDTIDRAFIESFFTIDTNPLPEKIFDSLKKIAKLILIKDNNLIPSTGIVFAGYGEDEFTPQILTYRISGFINDDLILFYEQQKSSIGSECGVIPYAQEDEVSAFMSGMTNSFSNQIIVTMQNTLIESSDSLLASFYDLIPSEEHESFRYLLHENLSQILDKNLKKLEVFQQNNYVNRVVDMIKFLPKQDLAYMAESLVNLTAFKRKVSNDSETVGGPIDVAVISKCDGFVWIKRKHYFSKELNRHFFQNN